MAVHRLVRESWLLTTPSLSGEKARNWQEVAEEMSTLYASL